MSISTITHHDADPGVDAAPAPDCSEAAVLCVDDTAGPDQEFATDLTGTVRDGMPDIGAFEAL